MGLPAAFENLALPLVVAPMFFGAIVLPMRWCIVTTVAIYLSLFLLPVTTLWVDWSELASPLSLLAVMMVFAVVTSIVLDRSQKARSST